MGRDTRRTRVILAMLLLTAVTLLVADPHGTGGLSATLRSRTGDVVGPLQRAGASLVRPLGSISGGVRHLGTQADRIRALQRENDSLRGRVVTGEDERRRLAELETLLALPTLADYPSTPARVVSTSSAQSLMSTVTIDAGSRDGVRMDAAVVNGRGLVGRVTSVSLSTATVLLACDPRVTVFVRAGRGGQQGEVTGAGCRKDAALLVPDPSVVLRPGTTLLTTGSPGNRPYVPDIPVGTVHTVTSAPGTLSTRGTVTLLLEVGSLDHVAVVLPEPRPARTPAVVGPAPSPSPAPMTTR